LQILFKSRAGQKVIDAFYALRRRFLKSAALKAIQAWLLKHFGTRVIRILGERASPRQYGYLFKDVALARGNDDLALARHYWTYGRRELAIGRRHPDRDLLNSVRLQRLSRFRDLPPSASFNFQIGNAWLDIVFFDPTDKFTPTIVAAMPQPVVGTRLLINAECADAYQGGIADVSSSILETNDWLKAIIHAYRPSFVRAIGIGMGGYAAIFHGAALNFNRIIAFDADISPDSKVESEQPQSEGARPLPNRDLTAVLPRICKKLHLLYSVDALSSFKNAVIAMRHGVTNIELLRMERARPSTIDWNVLLSDRDVAPETAIAEAGALRVRYNANFCERAMEFARFLDLRDNRAAIKSLERISADFPQDEAVKHWVGLQLRRLAIESEFASTDNVFSEPFSSHGTQANATGQVVNVKSILARLTAKRARVPRGSEPIVLAGHSHTVAISHHHNGDAIPALIKTVHSDRLQALIGAWPRDPLYWSELVRLSTQSSVALQWGGNEHMKYLFQPNPPFDFVARGLESLPIEDGLAIFPESLVRADFAIMTEGLNNLLAELQTTSRYDVIVLGSPPPKPDDSFLRERLASEPDFTKWLARMGMNSSTVPFTRPFIRLKLWHTLQGVFADAAQRHGARFLPVPDSVRDADGFLAVQHWGADVTHAGHAYGDIIAAEILRTLSVETRHASTSV
jgi:hypothetical protein